MSSGMRSHALSVAVNCVSSTSRIPSKLEDMQTERAMKLQLATPALEEKRIVLSLEENRMALALEEKKAVMAHKVSQKELALKAKGVTESSKDGGSNTDVSRKGKRVHIPKDLVPSLVVVDNINKWFEA